MKRNILKKTISLLLVLTMLIPLASPAFAAEALKTDTLAKASAPQLLGSSASGWALEKLAGGALSSVAGKGVNKIFEDIFGSDANRIMEKLKEISLKLDDISDRLDDLQRNHAKGELNTVLNEYQSFISGYYAMFDLLHTKSVAYGDSPEDTDTFMMDIYKGDKANYRIKGDGIISLTLHLTKKLTQVYNSEYNLFGAFDKLDRHVNRWEHQGYKDRQEFRDAVLGIYTEFQTLAQAACQKAMDIAEKRGDTHAYNEAKIEQGELINAAKIIKEMDIRCAIIKHPDLRIFRDIIKGKDLYAFYPRVDPASMKNPESFSHMQKNEYIMSMTTTNNISRVMIDNELMVTSAQVGSKVMPEIYKSYSGEKTLYEIMFDSKEGNFINVGNLPSETRFATNYYLFYEYKAHLGYDRFYRWITKIVDNNGIPKEKERLVSVIYRDDPYYGSQFLVDTLLDEKFFSVITYPLNLIKQGDLMSFPQFPESETAGMISGMESSYTLPFTNTITLSVTEKTGASYQWFIDKTGIGEKYEEISGATTKTYTLPALEPTMNGYMYRCVVIENGGTEEEIYTLADPVTLNLTGEGIPALITEHEVGNAEELAAALEKVADGSWDAHTLKLTASINYPHPISMTGGRDVTINLNGYTLTVQPDSDSEANINPMSNMAETAAVYACFGSLNITGAGTLDIVAGDGITYGVYAGEDGNVTVGSVTSTDGGTAVYATDGGSVEITGGVSADGDFAYAVQCFDGSNIFVSDNVSVSGNSACGMYVESFGENRSDARVGKNLTVSGEGSRAGLACGNAWLFVFNNITVTGDQSTGISAGGQGSWVMVVGDITAPADAVSAWDGAGVSVGNPEFELEEGGNVTVTDENATAISAAGAEVAISGNVTSSGSGGTGISASAWDLDDPVVGAWVMVDGKISACTPLRIESLPVGENDHSAEADEYGYYTFSDGISGIFIKEGALDSTDPNAKAPSIITHPKGGTVDKGDTVTLTVAAKVSDGGTLSYQWYSNTVDDHAGGTAIDGATSASYSPPTETVGTRYYYVIVTNTNENAQGDKTAQAISSLAAVTIPPTAYTVSIGIITGGAITASPTTAVAGETITLTITPDEGMRLKLGSLKYNDGTKDHVISGSSFIMPAANVTLAAEFVDASTPVTNYEKVMEDIAALSIGYAPGDSATAVTQNVRLTVTGAVYESSIAWTSSNTAVISDSGIVIRPGFTSGDAAITVSASVYNDGASGTRSFDLIVLKLPQITYTVTFDKNGGGTEASPATKEVISGGNVGALPTAPTRSGYTFIGWNTQANGSGTAFTAATAVTGSITVYAQWSRNSSGGGEGSPSGSGGTTTPVETPKTQINVKGNTATATTTVIAAVDSSGNAAATVSRTQVSDAISKAAEEAEKQGKGTVARVEIKVEASADAATVQTRIPKEAIDQASEAGIGALTISIPVASITFDANALTALSKEAAGDVKITASKVEASSLSPEAQRAVGDRPVFDFSVTSGDKTISQFGGEVSVSVPYTPKEGEDTNAIVIYFINDSGELEVVSNCIYDPATGRVSFSTRHFSKYAVGYNKVSFKDVAENAWYGKAVGFIAAREITTGTVGGNFSPEAKLTRGQFIVMLMRAYGIAPNINSKDNFADAGDTYYTGYLAAAKRLSISNGVGNNMFAPDREITRQEMFTLLYNALKAIRRLPEGTAGKPLSSFADAEYVASWAKEAMTLLVETGTISGNGGRLSPTSTTTRAEMAQVLYNLLSK